MRTSRLARSSRAACAIALLGLSFAPGAVSASSPALTPDRAAALGRQAFLYGFPLTEFLRVRATSTGVRCPNSAGDAPINAFSSARRFQTPADRTVVAPNVDTLYSIAELDLGRGPVVLNHPAMGRRYFVFQLLDPYTNTLAYIGSRTTGAAAGRFAITWSGHPGARPRGSKLIRVPYRRIWVIGRTLATGRRDQARALRLIGDYRLSPPGGPRRFAAGCRPGRVRRAPRLTGLQFLDRLSAALRENPPPRRDRTQLRRLARIGVGAGLAPERAGLTAVAMHSLVTAVNATAASLPALAKATILAQAKAHHGWTTPPADTGDYGTDYVTRAAIAEVGLGANTPAEAMYPTAYADASGATFDASKRYRLRFAPGQAPPARAFWSLTLYDAAGYLVSNPEHRYAVGSSHPPLRREADGSIVVAIQSARPTEPGVNWLPAPRRGAFRLSLRLYWPRAAALDGEWAPPAVQQR